jgi:hypothetical protein
MIESVGCTPLVSWGLFGAGIFIGAAFGMVIAGLCGSAKESDGPWLFWCPKCKSVVRTHYEEEA